MIFSDGWSPIMLTHTISSEQADEWCRIISREAGFDGGEDGLASVDWSSFAGRDVIKTRGDREKAIAAIYKRMPDFRQLWSDCLREKYPEMLEHEERRNTSIGMLVDIDGTLIQQCNFRLYRAKPGLVGW